MDLPRSNFFILILLLTTMFVKLAWEFAVVVYRTSLTAVQRSCATCCRHKGGSVRWLFLGMLSKMRMTPPPPHSHACCWSTSLSAVDYTYHETSVRREWASSLKALTSCRATNTLCCNLVSQTAISLNTWDIQTETSCKRISAKFFFSSSVSKMIRNSTEQCCKQLLSWQALTSVWNNYILICIQIRANAVGSVPN